MPVDDYLTPGEEIRYSSSTKIRYGEKSYQVFVTNRRIMMYARRGALIRGDDVVSIQLNEMHDVKYKERGFIFREGVLEFQGKTLVQLTGPPRDVKALYQQLMQFF